MRFFLPGCLFLAALLAPVRADEGMWTYNGFPSDKVGQKYGFSPSQGWLDHLRLSSARLAQGCSGSFVSANGLVLTNHHCAVGCVQNVSQASQDYVAKGFYAKSLQDERQCPGAEINQLVSITDVTGDVNAATQGKSGESYNEARNAAFARIEKGCATSDDFRCEVVTLYSGGKYDLYKYRRFQDVRLVFAPEKAIAFFGGDPDNFMFPRYDYDVSFLRVYDKNQPAKMEHHLAWSKSGAREGDVTFVSGHPGSTDRQRTIAELEYLRDVQLPDTLLFLAESRGLLSQYQTRGAEQARTAETQLFGVENSLKALKGEHQALVDQRFFSQKVAEEKAFRERVERDPKLKERYGKAWDEIAASIQAERRIAPAHAYIENSRGFGSRLYQIARLLVRSAEELPKANEQRLPEYAESKLPALRQNLLSAAPIYPELEVERLTFTLTKLRETLGPDHPTVRALFGKRSPREIATEAVQGSKLADIAVRKTLLDGGKAAVAASDDAMVKLARLVDPFARDIRKQYENEVESVQKRNGELLGRARFEAFGTSIYPDATFTLRLSYGQVKGYVDNGKTINPITIVGGVYERATGREPFALPQSWLDNKDKLNQSTPFNFVSTNDIIGGNSGSPVVNKDGEVVGLIFDGNIQSLGGSFGFDESVNRAVSVHSSVILEALDKVYGATRVLEEIQGRK